MKEVMKKKMPLLLFNHNVAHKNGQHALMHGAVKCTITLVKHMLMPKAQNRVKCLLVPNSMTRGTTFHPSNHHRERWCQTSPTLG